MLNKQSKMEYSETQVNCVPLALSCSLKILNALQVNILLVGRKLNWINQSTEYKVVYCCRNSIKFSLLTAITSPQYILPNSSVCPNLKILTRQFHRAGRWCSPPGGRWRWIKAHGRHQSEAPPVPAPCKQTAPPSLVVPVWLMLSAGRRSQSNTLGKRLHKATGQWQLDSSGLYCSTGCRRRTNARRQCRREAPEQRQSDSSGRSCSAWQC